MIHLPHLETNVTIACTRRCTHCNHFVPAQVDRFKSSMVEPGAFQDDLLRFARIAHADAFALIGGEPTLHPNIDNLIAIATCSGIADVIEVWTNGERLRQMSVNFWERMPPVKKGDPPFTLVVSAYPGVLTDEDLQWITEKCARTGHPLHIKDERHYPNFTRLLVPNEPAYTCDEATQRRYQQCWFKGYSRVLDAGHFYRCCTSPFIPQLLQGRAVGADGLCITDQTTSADVARFLAQPGFMESCRRCAGRNTDEAVPVAWGEEKDPAAWTQKSAEQQVRP